MMNRLHSTFNSRTARLGTCLLALVVCLEYKHASAQSRTTQKRTGRDLPLLVKQHDEAHTKFAAALRDLAKYCDEKLLGRESERIRQLAESPRTSQLRFNPLPREVQPLMSAEITMEERYWRTQLTHQQKEYAKTIYSLSRRALDGGHVSLAYDLVREVALHDPDHVVVRRILGYVRNGNEWVSPFEANMLRAKKVWHEQFGWIPREHVERYEGGERYYKTGWVSAAKEAELRRDFRNAWEVRTEHFLVKTNYSLEQGVQYAKKLEGFYDVFFQIMAGFFNSQEQARQLFEGTSTRTAPVPIPHEVRFYRTQEEYVAVLKKQTDQPVEITTGMYMPRDRIAYFYYNPEVPEDSTLYHEATHQLLSGSRPQAQDIGMRSNFWIVEGIACYMESFQRDGERFSVGDPSTIRVVTARYNYVTDGYYVPLREFARMGMPAFQSHREIRKNYSQVAGLTHFFMHYDNGRYRDALIEHLSQLYSIKPGVRQNPDSLAELTEVAEDELDRQYGAYMKALETAAAPAPAAAQ